MGMILLTLVDVRVFDCSVSGCLLVGMVLSISHRGVVCRAASAAAALHCFLHWGFPCCLSTNACADGQGSLSQAALPKAAMFDAVAPVLRGIIGIVISELWTPLEAVIVSLFG